MTLLLEKVAILITQYVNKDGAKKWVPENKPVPDGFTPTGASLYKRKGVPVARKK